MISRAKLRGKKLDKDCKSCCTSEVRLENLDSHITTANGAVLKQE